VAGVCVSWAELGVGVSVEPFALNVGVAKGDVCPGVRPTMRVPLVGIGVLVAGSSVNVAVRGWDGGALPDGVSVNRPGRPSGVFVSIDVWVWIVAVGNAPSPSTVGFGFGLASAVRVSVTSPVDRGDWRASSVTLTTGLAVRSAVGA